MLTYEPKACDTMIWNNPPLIAKDPRSEERGFAVSPPYRQPESSPNRKAVFLQLRKFSDLNLWGNFELLLVLIPVACVHSPA
jgi:hypothetical protein